MEASRFRSALRYMLSYLAEGLVWAGAPFGLPAPVITELCARIRRRRAAMAHAAHAWEPREEEPERYREALINPVTPLSRAESAEWAALVERLR